MAADSLFGGSTELSQVVSPASVNLINAFLTDTVGGTAATTVIGGSTLVTGIGHDGERQGVLLPSSSASAGTINDGALSLDFAMPPGVGLAFEGRDNATPEMVAAFLLGVIDTYLPAGAEGTAALRGSLISAVSDLVGSLSAQAIADSVVRVIDFPSSILAVPRSGNAAPGEMLLDVTGSSGNELFVLNLNSVDPSQTLVLSGVEKAMLAGAGTVRIAGDTGAMVTSDFANQHVIGGGGNDTLIGGGGNDTLTGGAGDDVFGFVRVGNFVINDFSPGDMIAFDIPGITDIGQIVSLVTGVTETAQSVTYHFGPDASITLVGLSAADVTASMVKFTF